MKPRPPLSMTSANPPARISLPERTVLVERLQAARGERNRHLTRVRLQKCPAARVIRMWTCRRRRCVCVSRVSCLHTLLLFASFFALVDGRPRTRQLTLLPLSHAGTLVFCLSMVRSMVLFPASCLWAIGMFLRRAFILPPNFVGIPGNGSLHASTAGVRLRSESGGGLATGSRHTIAYRVCILPRSTLAAILN